MKPRLTHICLHVEDIQSCVRFYQRYCQLEVVSDRSDAGKGSIYMAESNHQNELVIQFMSGGRSLALVKEDEQHFGFAVDSRDTVDAIANRAREDQILVWEADEYVPGAYLCTVRDPDGNHVEFSFEHSVPPS